MSGGAFDYVQYDAEELADQLEDVAEYAEDSELPEEVSDEVQEMADSLNEIAPKLRAIEWFASGDYGLETTLEELNNGGSDQ